MTPSYNNTKYSCYIGYITQGIVNNFAPLLFVAFSKQFGITLAQLSVIIVANFGIQICVDLCAVYLTDRIGLKKCAFAAHIFATAGLIMLAFLPYVMNPFWGVTLSVMASAIGGGLCEVCISPIIESCPFDNKAANMSLLHSFYSWGQLGVILISTIYFAVFGVENWRYLSLVWAIIPFANIVHFSMVPVNNLCELSEKISLKKLLSDRTFLLFFFLMFCGGSAEISMAQWASYFAETGIHVSKTVGDLLGPMCFALSMGIVRSVYPTLEKKYPLVTLLAISSGGCVLTYLLAALSPFPVLALVSCAFCGATVALMWPGVLSLSADKFKNGGGSMFAILAIGGDVGCTVGPWLVGQVSDFAGKMQVGLLISAIFPMIMLLGCIKLRRK